MTDEPKDKEKELPSTGSKILEVKTAAVEKKESKKESKKDSDN